jgi:hypothetical protein
MSELQRCLDERAGLKVTSRMSVALLLALDEGFEKIMATEKERKTHARLCHPASVKVRVKKCLCEAML